MLSLKHVSKRHCQAGLGCKTLLFPAKPCQGTIGAACSTETGIALT
jgi:hypothetical protein